ncbi:precorrin-6Y C5,15-methyltransferase (decarboxylating) [Kaistia soli DSM 19436]|uniref:Precorrin-6Y C5,15-methyltransferase (Decarboxylating) n=1 Tax=Kaistia soli DSM 19436 TaxID=1122133 RepID=A0A1M4X749_9HYPH|nr:precorrin-6y C5,15-methyltransferase (decarboxylating) subunit CbiE [Kaistia soli]SHE89329.1 precorrin-6Y C5,15-methyltransferase (decarboxylating) [Kaistia soli DSM 19436]
MSADPALSGPWLSIVGIGEDGANGLSPQAERAISAARFVFGGTRHLALAHDLIRGEAIAWPTPFSITPLLERRGLPCAVLASGDPFLYGVGNLIAKALLPSEYLSMPAPSAFSLAANRLGWPLADATTLSLHGRPLALIRPHLSPGRRLLVLTSDETAPASISALLSAGGFGPSRVTLMEALGGPLERIRTAHAEAFDLKEINPLNLLAIEVVAAADARIVSRVAGLDDALYESDGQITKREIRALTLSALSPRPGQRLWDIGAGSGSVGIEWMLAGASLSAIAIEPRADRAARIRRNAEAFGVPGLAVVEGSAPEALAGLPVPDAIFIGGGASRPGVLDVVMTTLPSSGRLVVNAVTLETERLVLAAHAEQGGSLIRIAIDRALPLAGMTAWEPARPITQWTWVRP